MANSHGTPIWYELITPDPDAAKAFYDDVAGWTIEPRPSGEIDYRMIATGDGLVGGVMRLNDDMASGGAKPGWLFYIGVDDVDATADTITAAGGAVLMPPWNMPGVGRMAFVADPQGAPFYIMRGAGDADSTVFAPGKLGHGGWHELQTSDATAAVAFYRQVFGWENRETMEMGPMGGYHFLDLGDLRLGALMRAQAEGVAPRWHFYFNVPDADAAVGRIERGGGAVTQGPHEVPGGSRIVVGTDPQGATFALVAQARES